jgi:tetratricopeptide (TPR) repeat protein
MGEVYAAYDPELDRKIAIKLLRARGDSADGGTRLLREAQAIAKLSHPNVVVVYDVGTHGDSVFIAMEFLEGRTLTGWMTAEHTPREILDVFLAAGRGLEAAHAADLVHRDFKPDNVMVTNDGQVRVMDFGLARQAGSNGAAAKGAANGAQPRGAEGDVGETFNPNVDPDATMNLAKGTTPPVTGTNKFLSVKLTQTGAMLGTPAYMAPEQFGMRATDARTDQFSFCVALYEMLYGARPFPGDSFAALMTSVSTGAVSEPPAKARVPGWLRRVLLRGLEVNPARRYPSMGELLAALQNDPTVRRRRVLGGVAALVLVGVALAGVKRASGPSATPCHGAEAHWAGVWEAGGAPSARKDAIRQAFDASGRSYAAQAFANVSRLLDDYVRRWQSAYVDACEATAVRAEQSPEVLDLRMTCLRERVDTARALSDVFARADGTVVENAVSAAGALPSLDRCADVKALKAVVRAPEDPTTRKRVEDLGVEVAGLTAERMAGHCAIAKRLAESVLPRARALGYEPLLADALATSGMMIDACVEPSVAFAWFRESFAAGLASGDDETADRSAIMLSAYLPDRAGRTADGREWHDVARALLRRLGPKPILENWMHDAESLLFLAEGNGAAAAEGARLAVEARLRAFGPDHPELPVAYNSFGNSLHVEGRDREALAAFAEARATATRLFGASHPMVAMISNNEGEVLNTLGRHAEARAQFQRALDIWTTTDSSPFVRAFALTGLGTALVAEGRDADAVSPLEQALAVRIQSGADREHLAETRFALARALWPRPEARGRAVALARLAHDGLARAETHTIPGLSSSVEAWLAAHGAPSAR